MVVNFSAFAVLEGNRDGIAVFLAADTIAGGRCLHLSFIMNFAHTLNSGTSLYFV